MAFPALFGFSLLTSATFLTIIQFIAISLVVQILLKFGVVVMIFIGLDLALTSFHDEIISMLSSVNNSAPNIYNLMEMAGVLDAINIIFATMATIIAFKTISGTLKSLVFGGST